MEIERAMQPSLGGLLRRFLKISLSHEQRTHVKKSLLTIGLQPANFLFALPCTENVSYLRK